MQNHIQVCKLSINIILSIPGGFHFSGIATPPHQNIHIFLIRFRVKKENNIFHEQEVINRFVPFRVRTQK